MADDQAAPAEGEAPASNVDDVFEEFQASCPSLAGKDEDFCYKEIFRCFDEDRKGFLTSEMMKAFFGKIQAQVQLTDEEIEMLIKDIDKNDDKKVDFGEFQKFMQK